MRAKQTPWSSTYALEGGGFLHIDRIIIPIRVPRRLGAVPPLAPSCQDEKMPIAEAGNASPLDSQKEKCE